MMITTHPRPCKHTVDEKHRRGQTGTKEGEKRVSSCPKTAPREHPKDPGAPKTEVSKMNNALVLLPHGSKSTPKQPRSTPKRLQERPKRFKKLTPNRKTKKELNQDDPSTV